MGKTAANPEFTAPDLRALVKVPQAALRPLRLRAYSVSGIASGLGVAKWNVSAWIGWGLPFRVLSAASGDFRIKVVDTPALVGFLEEKALIQGGGYARPVGSAHTPSPPTLLPGGLILTLQRPKYSISALVNVLKIPFTTVRAWIRQCPDMSAAPAKNGLPREINTLALVKFLDNAGLVDWGVADTVIPLPQPEKIHRKRIKEISLCKTWLPHEAADVLGVPFVDLWGWIKDNPTQLQVEIIAGRGKIRSVNLVEFLDHNGKIDFAVHHGVKPRDREHAEFIKQRDAEIAAFAHPFAIAEDIRRKGVVSWTI